MVVLRGNESGTLLSSASRNPGGQMIRRASANREAKASGCCQKSRQRMLNRTLLTRCSAVKDFQLPEVVKGVLDAD
eukprot:11183523-Lingulodinium_polyedra.AAC.1